MCDLLQKLNCDSEIRYRRCGEIVVAPERNIFALYCHLCQDFFMHFSEFVRHARRDHDDEYEFEITDEDNADVYDIDEIVGGMSLEQINAMEREEWDRRKKVYVNGKEKFEAKSLGNKGVTKVSEQYKNMLNEQKSAFQIVKLLEERKNAINQVEEDSDADVYDIDEIVGGMSLEQINAMEKEEWNRRKIVSANDGKEKFEAMSLGNKGVTKVSEQYKIILNEQKSAFQIEKMLEDRKNAIDQVEEDSDEIQLEIEMLLKQSLSNHNEKNNAIITKQILADNVQVDNSTIAEQNSVENIVRELEINKTSQIIGECIDKNVENRNESLNSEKSISMELETSELTGLLENIIKPLLSEENINSLELKSDDLSNLLKNTTEPSVLEEYMLAIENSNLTDESSISKEKDNLVLEISDLAGLQETTRAALTKEKEIYHMTSKSLSSEDPNLVDLDKITRESLISEEKITLGFEMFDLVGLHEATKERLTTNEKINPTVLVPLISENPYQVNLHNITRECLISERLVEPLKFENPNLTDVQENSNETLNWEKLSRLEVPSKLSNLENPNLIHLGLEDSNVTDAHVQRNSKEASTCEKLPSSFVLENPDLADLLSEFDTDLDSFDMRIFEKLASPKKILGNDIENNVQNSPNSEINLPLVKGRIDIGFNTLQGTEISSNADIEVLAKVDPKKSDRSMKESERNKKDAKLKKSTGGQFSSFDSKVLPIETKEIHLRRRTLRVKSTSSPEEISYKKGNSKSAANTVTKTNNKSVDNESNIKLNNNLMTLKKSPIQNKKNIPIKIELTTKTPIKVNLKHTNKKVKKSFEKNDKNHLAENASPIISPINEISNKLLSPDEAQFHKMLKVRVKKLSPSPKEEKTENYCNLSPLKIDNRMPLEFAQIQTKPQLKKTDKLLPQSVNNESKSLHNPKVVDMEQTTPIKNMYSKQNFTEQNLKNFKIESAAKCNKDNTTTSQLQLPNNKKIMSGELRSRTASIDILPVISSEIIVETPFNKKNSNIQNHAITRTTQRKHVLKRMTQIRKRISQILDEGQVKTKKDLNDAKITDKENIRIKKKIKENGKEKRQKIEIQNETILQPNNLPKIKSLSSIHVDGKVKFEKNLNENKNKVPHRVVINNVEILKSNDFIKNEPLPSFEVFKKPISKLETVDELNDKSQSIYNTNKIQNANPRIFKSEKISKSTPKNSNLTDLEETKLELSDSVVSFLQNDLAQNKLDVSQLHNILKQSVPLEENSTKQIKLESSSSTSIVEELLNQVVTEDKPNGQSSAEKEDKIMDAIKEEKEYEVELLKKVGLSFIRLSEMLPLEEEEDMHSKAKKLASIFQHNDVVWNTKNLKHKIAEERELCFNLMKQEVNCAYGVNLSLTDIKRIFNLIMSWYSEENDAKFIEKKDIPINLKRFYELFVFLPKIGRPVYNCEFCAEQFRSKHSYLMHRSVHTGRSPYICGYCGKAFARAGSFKNHENKHIENNLQKQEDASPLMKNNAQRINLKRQRSPESHVSTNDAKRCQIMLKTIECDICNVKFKNSKDLYEHKIKHLKRVYKCEVCEKVLTSAIDLYKHIAAFHKQTKLHHKAINE